MLVIEVLLVHMTEMTTFKLLGFDATHPPVLSDRVRNSGVLLDIWIIMDLNPI